MSLICKDTRNNKFLKTQNHHQKYHPLENQNRLQNKVKRLTQRITAVEDHINKIEQMQQDGDLNYYDLVRYNYPELAEVTRQKIEKLTPNVERLIRLTNRKEFLKIKGQQKEKSLDYRLSVKMY